MLAAQLAAHFGTVWVPEYGRSYCELHGTDLAMADLLEIARVQTRLIGRCPCARRPLGDRGHRCADDGGLGRHDAGDARSLVRGVRRDADLYLLLDIDLPFIDDGLRLYGGAEARGRFFELCKAELERRGVAWALVGGTGEARLAGALAAIRAMPEA